MSNEEYTAGPRPERIERKLAAILSADVQGYSRLMGEDEEATIRTLTAYREVIATLIQQHRGRVVDSPGDNLLAEFASAVDAMQGAVEIQRELRAKNADLPDARKMEYRIGINVGDVVVEGVRLYGDGVNIAARLEGLAAAGGICIAGTVYDQVKTKLPLHYEYLGEQAVKNIAGPGRVWRVRLEEAGSPVSQQNSRTSRRVGTAHRPWVAGTVAGLILALGVIATVRHFTRPPPSPQDSALRTDAAAAALPLPDKPSLAVLPFTNPGGDPDQDTFTD